MKLSQAKKVTAPLVKATKGDERISVLTAYDYQTARVLDNAGIDIILVGDSLEMVHCGAEHTVSATMEQMLYHTNIVKRALRRALLVADLPFGSYHVSEADALQNAIRMVKEGGAEAVKIEGGARMHKTIANITNAEIPVMGHIGLTPQSIHKMGGYKKQRAETILIEDALAAAEAGAFALVLELIEADIATKITERVSIPTIGIGSGKGCDGEVLVINDAIGFLDKEPPPFAKQYANVSKIIDDVARAYIQDVRNRS